MKNSLFPFFVLFCLLPSCEYENETVFVSEAVPLQDDFTAEINLSTIPPNSTLFVYEPTMLTFEIDTKGHDVINLTISIDNTEDANIYDNSIYLYPLGDNSVRKLIFDIELKTNTGSIAEKLGLEKYVGRYEYNVKFVKLEEDFDVNFHGGISEDGYLQLQWIEPELENATFLKYELTFFNMIAGERETRVITNPKETSFIDENYVWGDQVYELTVHYKNNDIDYESWKISRYTPEYYGSGGVTRFSYRYIDHEWMDVSWEYTGYKCKYLLMDANEMKIERDGHQRTAKIQRFRFPSDPQRFKLYILPYHLEYDDYEKCPFIAADFMWGDERQTILEPPLAWNVEKDEYYYLHAGHFNINSMSTFEKKEEYLLRQFSDPLDRFVLSAAPGISQVAISKNIFSLAPNRKYEIFIYDTDDFDIPPVRVQILSFVVQRIFLTTNGYLFYKDDVRDENNLYTHSSIFVVNSKTGEKVTSKKMEQNNFQISVSHDGKYICEHHEGTIHLYTVEEGVILPIYSHTNGGYAYDTCQFSSLNPNELILSGGNETIIFDLDLLGEKYKIKGRFIMQDIKTGNYACLDEFFSKNSHLVIYDAAFTKVLAKIPFYFYYAEPHYFVNNRLIFCAPGHYTSLDITDYMQ